MLSRRVVAAPRAGRSWIEASRPRCIVAALASVDEAEFGVVRDRVEVSDSVLSKQVVALHPYVLMRKGYVGKRPRSWLRLTRTGRKAYERHLEALRDIAGD